MIKEITLPASKSYLNRALILAALTKKSVTISPPYYSDDTMAMILALKTIGVEIKWDQDKITVIGDIFSLEEKEREVFVHDSGTTLRFLLALLCFVPGKKRLFGSPALNRRPIKPLALALLPLGVKISYLEKEGYPPLEIVGTACLHTPSINLDASISSQFLSALLMVSPLLNGVELELSLLVSKPYVDMTLAMMKAGGVQVLTPYKVPHAEYNAPHYEIEGDFSSASYFLAWAALHKKPLTLKGLNPFSLQADRLFLTILEKMGNPIEYGTSHLTIYGKQIEPLTIDLQEAPDLACTLAVLLAFAPGKSKLYGLQTLPFKESHRLLALSTELKKMGIDTAYDDHSLTICGATPHAALIETHNDHRIAMAFAIAQSKIPELVILNPEVVTKTFPHFWEMFNALG